MCNNKNFREKASCVILIKKFLLLVMMVSAMLMLMCCRSDEPSKIEVANTPLITDEPNIRETPAVSERVTLSPSITVTPAFTPSKTPEPTPVPTVSIEAQIQAFIEGLTVEQKLGQLVMFGVKGTETIDEQFVEVIEEYSVGNIILFGANVDKQDESGGFETMRGFIDTLNACNPSGIPRLYSIDVEGGSVRRFVWDRKLYSAYELGSMDESDAIEQFTYIAEALRELGINVDLAPVVDVAPDPLNTFLGERIFSFDPEVVSRMGAAVINGLHEGGCLSVAKHFPGHGGTAEDSHEITPIVEKSADELYAYDLIPFADAVGSGIDGVLVAHILYPALDPDDIASMSDEIITDLLRGEMGFDGIVLSDDFRMSGLRSRYGLREAAVKFILAGGDMILCGAVSGYQHTIMEAIYEAYESGVLTEERIDQSVYRVLYAKYDLGIWQP